MKTILEALAEVPFPQTEDNRTYGKLIAALVVYLRTHGTTVHTVRHDGGVPKDFLDRFMKTCGYEITWSTSRTQYGWDIAKKECTTQTQTSMVILNDNLLVGVSEMGSYSGERLYDYYFAFVGRDPSDLEMQTYRDLTSEYLSKPQPKVSTIGVFSLERGGMSIATLELPAINYQPDNYSAEINDWWKKLEASINDETKLKGKLTILQGPPGCGKTMFLRSMLSHFREKTQSKFIYVPLNVAVRLSSPETIPILKQYANKKIILVIEDADAMLEDRAKNGSGPISEFLNVTDGILGAALNLHVVATTNLTKTQFDPAIVRPGRLQSLLQFQELSAEHAGRIYLRETGKVLVPSKETYSLAEIYCLATEENNGVKEHKRVSAGQYL